MSRDSLPLHSSSFKRHWWLWHRVNLCLWSVHSPLAISNPLRDSDHTVDCFFVPPVLMFYPPDLPRPEYTFCCSYEKLSTVVSHSQPHTQTCIEDSFCSMVLKITVSPTPSRRMPCNLSNGVRPSRPFLALGQKCCPHVPPTMARSGNLIGVLLVGSSAPHGT